MEPPAARAGADCQWAVPGAEEERGSAAAHSAVPVCKRDPEEPGDR